MAPVSERVVLMRYSRSVSLLALTFVTACGGGGDKPAEATKDVASNITVYTFGQPQMLLPQQQAAKTFEETTGIKVNLVNEPAFDQLQPTLEGKAKEGSSDYDVYMTGNL